ncbi:hypothetical protein L1887_06607 [Cichorium endivia]|nr:hypothetical protein L1887_06607 [Cichorium endivia]
MDRLHPAITVTNIKNFIPITLEQETGPYTSWAELFKIHCRAYEVLDHILPGEVPAASEAPAVTDKDKPKDPPATSKELWKRLDAIVLQWIYGTISTDLLNTIIKPNVTAEDAWNSLSNLFRDNRATRAIYLQNQFSNTKLSSFSNMAAYCKELKIISDKLSNVDAPVTEQQLVLQLIAGLNDQYEGVAMLIQQTTPLPDFSEARSRLILEESRKAHQTSGTALLSTAATAPSTQLPTAASGSPQAFQTTSRGFQDPSQPHQRQGGRGSDPSWQRGRGRGGRGRGRGRSRGRSNYGNNAGPYAFYPPQPWNNQSQPWNWFNQPWNVPPCPYPTAPGHRPPSQSPGILGAPPSQVAYASSESSYAPTNIEQAMHTMTLNPDQNWYLDTGATNHMTNTTGNLSTYVNNSMLNNIVVGNGSQIHTLGTGHTTLKPPYPPLKLQNILVAPNLIKNLLSVRRLTTDNLVAIEFDPFGFLVKDFQTKIPILRCDSTGDLYPLSLPSTRFTSPSTFAALSQDIWHHRLGHPGSSLLRALNKQKSISVSKFSDKRLCQSCVFGKQVKLPFHDSLSSTSLPFDIVHSDVWTSPVLSTGGHRYYILFLDDYTNFLWTYPLSKKSNVFRAFSIFQTLIKTQFERPIKTFQCDNGTEYNNQSFHNFCTENGLVFRFSCPYTSAQNGKAERKIRSINNIVRTLLTHASLPPSFWHHALSMATYILNILPSKTKNNLTPTRLLYRLHPTYTHLRTFGCLCYPLLPSTSIHKLANRSSPCVFLGYPSNHRGYKCYDLSSHKIIISRHVEFDENIFPFAKNTNPAPSYEFLHSNLSSDPHPSIWTSVQTPDPLSTASPPNHPPTQPIHRPSTPPPSNMTNHDPPTTLKTYSRRSKQNQPSQNPTISTSPPPQPTSIPTQNCPGPARSVRHIQTRSMTGNSKPKQTFNLTSSSLVPIPKNPAEALTSPVWTQAMTDEFRALIDNNTWELIPRRPDMNIIRCMWIFKHKTKSDGSLERYKARLVCDGRSQQVGVDCAETFSPVVKPATIRTVLSIALHHNWAINQLDVKNAFLHGHLSETVFMHQPPGFKHRQFPNHVCRLKRSLYGLKQAPRAWYQRFTDYVTSLGFRHSSSDHSLFIYQHGGETAYLLLYVDEILLTTSSSALKTRLMSQLAKEFAMKDLGPLSYFLGISVTRQDGGLFLSQQKYAQDILRRAKMDTCNPVQTPIDTTGKLSADSGDLIDDPTS